MLVVVANRRQNGRTTMALRVAVPVIRPTPAVDARRVLLCTTAPVGRYRRGGPGCAIAIPGKQEGAAPEGDAFSQPRRMGDSVAAAAPLLLPESEHCNR